MLARVAKEFDFHAAHVLPNHDGQCARLHGHTYRMRVVVEGWVKDANGDPDEGMVVDFQALKTIYKDKIEPLVEHQNLNETLKEIVPLTTCENMCAWMAYTFRDALNIPNAHVVAVRLWETPTSWAEIKV